MNRPALVDSQFGVRATQRIIGQAASIRGLENHYETSSVVILPSVEAEHLLINIGVKMERTRANVRPVKRALEAAPEVLNRVGMHAAFAVRHPMVDEGVRIANIREPAIRSPRIGVDRRVRKHVSANVREQRRTLAIRNDHRFDFGRASALRHAKDRRFALEWIASGFIGILARSGALHPATTSTDEGFVRLHLALELRGGIVAHRLTNPVQHEPRRLLRHAERPRKFVRGCSVLGVGEQPQSREPFAKRDRALLEDRPGLSREHALAIFAAPGLAGRNELHGSRAATHPGTGDRVRPADLDEVGPGPVRVREVGHGFEEGRRLLVHTLSMYSAGDTWVASSGESDISS